MKILSQILKYKNTLIPLGCLKNQKNGYLPQSASLELLVSSGRYVIGFCVPVL